MEEDEPLTFDELADMGESLRMPTEQLIAELKEMGMTEEDLEKSKKRTLALIQFYKIVYDVNIDEE